MNWPTALCKSCGRVVIWARTTNDKNIPIDADPSDDGTFILEERGSYSGTPWILARTLTVEERQQSLPLPGGRKGPALERVVVFRKSHFATCPNAEKHRQPRQQALGWWAPVRR